MQVDPHCLQCSNPEPHNNCSVLEHNPENGLCVPTITRQEGEEAVRAFLRIVRVIPQRKKEEV